MDRVQAVIGKGDADELGLCAVDCVAQNPAAPLAVGIHPLLASGALAAGRDARNQDMIAYLGARNAVADFFHDADACMPQNPPRRDGRHIAFEDM